MYLLPLMALFFSYAELPMIDPQLLAMIASMAVLALDHFPCPTDKWEVHPHNLKTWTAWKVHYRATHIARKCQQLAVGRNTGTANSVMEVEDSTIS